LIALNLKGLTDVISVSVVHPTWQRTRPDDTQDLHCGWVFQDPSAAALSQVDGFGEFDCDGCIPDTVNHVLTVRDLYDKAGFTGKKFTVPVLWDIKTSRIVNNESADIVRMLNASFNEFARNPEMDLYPQELHEEIDAINKLVYDDINNGVYKCGFAKSQRAYDDACTALFRGLDHIETILSSHRY